MSWKDWPSIIKGGFIGAFVGIMQVFLSFFDLGCPFGECSVIKKMFLWMGAAGLNQCKWITGCQSCDICMFTIGPVLMVIELTLIGVLIGWMAGRILGKGRSY